MMELKGVDRAIANLNAILQSLDEQEVAREFQDPGDAIVADARRNAPVRTGNFRDNIRAEVRVFRGGNPGVLILVDGTAVPYAHFVELGTDDTPAHFTIRAAADSNRNRVVQMIADRLRARIQGAVT